MYHRVVVAVFSCACGRIGFDANNGSLPGGSSVVGAVDGMRLHAERWVTPDNVRGFARWYDVELGMPCDWGMLKGLRCLPHANADAFSDAACTVAAVRAPPGCAPPAFAMVSFPQSMPVAVGNALTTTAYIDDFGQCKPASDGATYYALGAQIPEDTFIGGARVVTPIGDGLSTVEIVGDDGSRYLFDVQNTADSSHCLIIGSDKSHVTCLPDTGTDIAQFTHEYLDAACSFEVVEYVGPPTYAPAAFSTEPCTGYGIAIGAAQPGTRVYVRNASGACVLRPNPVVGGLAAIADASTMLPQLSLVEVGRGARLRATAWRTPGGALLQPGFYDSLLQASCIPTTDATSGRVYCVPLYGTTGGAMSPSANCSAPTVNMATVCGGGRVLRANQVESCTGKSSQFLTFNAPVSTPVSLDVGGVCGSVDTTGVELFLAGMLGSYDPSGLAELALTRD